VSRLNAAPVYLVMVGANSLLRSTMYLVITIYYVLQVQMNPLELVLAGTVLEVVYFLCQMPTGMFADVFSRRTSIVIGWAIAGACFALEGLVPRVGAILIAQGVLGIGEAFIDGAESAWLADEVGNEQFGQVTLRGSQIGQLANIAGIAVATVLGSWHLSLPVVIGGVGMVAMSVFFGVAMPENGFRPKPREVGRTAFHAMGDTLRNGVRAVRGSSVLLTVLAVEVFFGGSSEGFDRLWEAHLIRDIHLPAVGSLQPVVWFAVLAIIGSVTSMGANRLLKPRLDRITGSQQTVARVLAALNVIYVGCTVAFALSGNFLVAAVFLTARVVVGTPSGVLLSVWFNQSIPDPSVRATVMSMSGQCNALGQWIGGPLVGLLGNALGLRAAITATGLIPLPNSALFALAGRQPVEAPQVDESAQILL
jgi:DHA3 family tetracycline resistance protein-like MFS transporter